MKTSVNERLEQLIKALDLNPYSFSAKVRVTPVNVYNIIKGRNAPSFDLLVKIFNSFPNVRMEWFLLGEGKMFKNEQATLQQLMKKVDAIIVNGMDGQKQERGSLKTLKRKNKNNYIGGLILA